jgi:hypothetical protein
MTKAEWLNHFVMAKKPNVRSDLPTYGQTGKTHSGT